MVKQLQEHVLKLFTFNKKIQKGGENMVKNFLSQKVLLSLLISGMVVSNVWGVECSEVKGKIESAQYKFITEYNLTGCTAPSFKDWQTFDQILKEINKRVYLSIKPIEAQQQKIRITVKCVGEQLNKVYSLLEGANLLVKYAQINQFLDRQKASLGVVEKEITDIRKTVEKLEKEIANLLCQTNKFIQIANKKAQEFEGKGIKKAAVNYRDTANKLSTKAQRLNIVLKSFDTYHQALENLLREIEKNVEYIKSLQLDIIAYKDVVCKEKTRQCIYTFPTDPRIGKAEMLKRVIEVEKKYKDLVKMASYFSEKEVK